LGTHHFPLLVDESVVEVKPQCHRCPPVSIEQPCIGFGPLSNGRDVAAMASRQWRLKLLCVLFRPEIGIHHLWE
jgi:hypothetical protein